MVRKVRRIDNYYFPSLYKHVGIYCRVSSRFQEQLESMASQASGFVQMVSKCPDWILSDIYLDFKSGDSVSNRHEFQRMLQDAKDGKLDLILTKSISRFGRNVTDTLSALRELKALNVFVMFDKENINTATEESELTLTILAAYAESENASRRELQNMSIKQKLMDGTSNLFSRPCYGYKNTSEHKRVLNKCRNHELFAIYDSHPALITREIFEAVQNEKARRSNITVAGDGCHRKSTKYSSKP